MSETYTPPTLPADLANKVAALPFTATLTYKARNPQAGPDTWICSLHGEPFNYSKGVGLRDGYKGETRTHYGVQQWLRKSRPVDPTAPELLAGLIMDASCYADSADLDDFAANFGDVTQGIQKTLDAYNACARADRLLRRWFTPAELDALREWASQL